MFVFFTNNPLNMSKAPAAEPSPGAQFLPSAGGLDSVVLPSLPGTEALISQELEEQRRRELREKNRIAAEQKERDSEALKELTSRAKELGLNFPIDSLVTELKNKCSGKIAFGAPVYLAAVLEYLTHTLLDAATTRIKSQESNPAGRRSVLGKRRKPEAGESGEASEPEGPPNAIITPGSESRTITPKDIAEVIFASPAMSKMLEDNAELSETLRQAIAAAEAEPESSSSGSGEPQNSGAANEEEPGYSAEPVPKEDVLPPPSDSVPPSPDQQNPPRPG